ncbi:MAG: precorrin-2 C(20)-methyltransferase [Bacillota bacterium]|nr:precorrin-2 C(20)-methyltransferase [Bacillota bacterium]
MTGILYGVGVGPGDPELMTLKAVRLIKENDIIALPGAEPKKTAAYQIAAGAVPELADKQLISIYMPMTNDKEEQRKWHQKGAEIVEAYLKEGKNVVYLTLGDPTVYSTFTYIQRIVEERGFQTQLISAVPSFCAAAARANMPLSIWNENIHIFPAMHNLKEDMPETGTCVLMKSGSKLKQVKEIIKKSGRDAVMVENCGMQKEQVYLHVDEIPDTAGYYSLIIAKEAERK